MSTSLNNTNYAQIVAEAQSKIKDLLNLGNVDVTSSTTSSNGGKGYNGPDIGNILNGTANNVAALAQGNDQQKAGAIQNIFTDLMDLFSSTGTGANSQARKAVKSNDKKIEDNKKSAEETFNQVSDKVQAILDNCEQNTANIANALDLIKELGGDKGQIADLEKQLEEWVATIEENQKILAQKDASPEEKKNALLNILNASKMISGLVDQVDDFKAQIEEQNSVVEENATQLTELMTESGTAISEGVTKIQKNLVDAGVLTQEQSTMSVKAVKNTGVGTAQEATGQAMTSFWATAAQGAKYILSGNDKLSAGATLMQGSVQGLSKLTGSIGDMGQYLTYFTEFGNGLGSFAEGSLELVGQYDATVNPIISSIGSWKSVAEGSKVLETEIQVYAQEVLGQSVNSGDSTKANTQSSIPNLLLNPMQQGTEIDANDVANTDSNEMKFERAFEFDTSLLRLKAE